MMVPIVIALVLIFIGIGALGIVSPARQVAFASVWESKTGLWASAILRLVLGIALWVVAPSSRAPVFLQILAVLSLIAAFGVLLMGFERYKSTLIWWKSRSTAFIRAWSAVAVVLGLFVLWAIVA